MSITERTELDKNETRLDEGNRNFAVNSGAILVSSYIYIIDELLQRERSVTPDKNLGRRGLHYLFLPMVLFSLTIEISCLLRVSNFGTPRVFSLKGMLIKSRMPKKSTQPNKNAGGLMPGSQGARA